MASLRERVAFSPPSRSHANSLESQLRRPLVVGFLALLALPIAFLVAANLPKGFLSNVSLGESPASPLPSAPSPRLAGFQHPRGPDAEQIQLRALTQGLDFVTVEGEGTEESGSAT